MQHVEVARLLGEDLARHGRVAVDQRAAVERREEPLVGVDDEAVGVANAAEEVAVGGREDRGAAVGAVDVEPEVVLAREAAEPLEVVDDARVGGAGRGDDADHVLGVGVGARAPPRGRARVKRWSSVATTSAVHAEHVQGLADAGVRVGGDREAHAVGVDARGAWRARRRAPRSRLERLPIEPPETKAPPEPSGSPARSARKASAWFSATTTPLDSSQLVPFSPEQATTMSKSNEFFVGAFGMKAKKPGESIETTAGARVVAKKLEHLVGVATLGT